MQTDVILSYPPAAAAFAQSLSTRLQERGIISVLSPQEHPQTETTSRPAEDLLIQATIAVVVRLSEVDIVPSARESTTAPAMQTQGRLICIDLDVSQAQCASPAPIADSIIATLSRVNDDQPRPRWVEPLALIVDSGAVRSYQGVPIDHMSEHSARVAHLAVSRILSLCEVTEDEVYWPRGGRSVFDRLHETTSALTALGQAGLDASTSLISLAIRGIAKSDPGNVQDRAATVYLMSIGRVPEPQIVAFASMLADHQQQDPSDEDFGSMILPQGDPPTDGQDHWERPTHPGGAVFHACHLGEALLTIPSSMRAARAAAEPLISGFRSCLKHQFERHDGWIVGHNRRPSQQVLYAYAVAPQLGIPLPANWQRVVAESLTLAKSSTKAFDQSLAVMNVCYLAQILGTPEARTIALEFSADVLPSLTQETLSEQPRIVRDSAFLRALTYASLLVDSRHARVIQGSAWRALRDWASQED